MAQFVGGCAQIRDIKRQAFDVAPTDLAVLIVGETGTGKEVLAKWIHERSGRPGPFVVVDCGALPPTLIEVELFGHERGAYTGATGSRMGLLQEAEHGTVFLDEVGELALESQTRLLGALDRHAVRRIGSNHHTPIDVRFISATHKDLPQEVTDKRFRRDLLFRLAGFTFMLPPLRERIADIPALLAQFLPADCTSTFSDGAMQCLRDHPWMGNIRELQLFARRVAVLVKEPVVEARHVKDLLYPFQGIQCKGEAAGSPPAGASINRGSCRLRELREEALHAALAETGGNVLHAARLLGVGKSTVYGWLSQKRPTWG